MTNRVANCYVVSCLCTQTSTDWLFAQSLSVHILPTWLSLFGASGFSLFLCCLSLFSTHTTCGWKGVASYYTVSVNGKDNVDAAWYYPDPKPAAKNIKDHVAFWRGVTVKKT